MPSAYRLVIPLLLLLSGLHVAWGWGNTGHRFVNGKGVLHLPAGMSWLASQSTFLTAHASDADTRKSSDTAEYPKHFLDLEAYPDYRNLPRNLSDLIAAYGWATVRANGTLPWATVQALDSMRARLRRGDLTGVLQPAADLGHYVADAHQPLHCTVNYDGQATGNGGIHSRYESQMVNLYESSLSVSAGSVRYISDPYRYMIDRIVASNALVDSILQADNAAKVASGWNGSGTAPSAYYASLWQRTAGMTNRLMQSATEDLASFWYTAWIDAGMTATGIFADAPQVPAGITLHQNYPNPFNPTTIIAFSVQDPGPATLSVYDVQGREVAVLADGRFAPGVYRFSFRADGLAGGAYVAILRSGGNQMVRRMMLIK